MDSIVYKKFFSSFISLFLISMLLSTVASGQSWNYEHNSISGLVQGVEINQDVTKSAVLNEVISVDMRGVTVLTALEKVAKQVDLELIYNTVDLESANYRLLTLKIEEMPINQILWSILEDTGFRYAVSSHGQLIIMRHPGDESIEETGEEFMQETITGRVIDAQTGEALPGVNVIVVGSEEETGSTIGVTTNMEGMYSIQVPEGLDILLFTYIGYQRTEVDIDGRLEVDIQLNQDIHMLDDVVVVGYGVQERANLTGSVSTVRAEALEDRPITNAAQGLQGAIPNLNITLQSGDPHSDGDVSFNIRGYESISGGSPLILVDGAPMNLQHINPNDIESVTVLRDAAASAIYGARAAFGVVLVTTKSSGRNEPLNLSFSSQLAFNVPIWHMDIIDNTCDYMQARNMAALRGDGSPTYPTARVEGACAYYEDPINNPEYVILPDGTIQYYGYADHRKETIRNSTPQMQNEFSISGGSDRASYYTSFSIFNHDGLYKMGNDNFRRFNFLLRADFDVNSWIKVDPNIAFNKRESDQPHIYSTGTSLNTLARVPVSTMISFPLIEGLEEYEGMYFGGNTMIGNLANGGRDLDDSSDLWLRPGITLTPFEQLEIRGEFAYNNYTRSRDDQQTQVQFINNNAHDIGFNLGFTSNDYIQSRVDEREYYKFETYANYRENIGLHNVGLMAGYSQELTKTSYVQATGFDVITPTVPNVSATLGSQQINGGASELALRGIFYRVNYNYDGRYLIESNGRYDGSSRFTEGDRYGFFPSVSVGWRLSHENFMEKTRSFLDELKIRASYGTLGNQELAGYYPAISTMNVYLGAYTMTSGRIPTVNFPGLVSPTLTWESVTTQNLGLDISLFGNKLESNFDIYTRDTRDMLMGTNFPDILGTSSPSVNAADLRTSGWEFAISWRDAISTDLSYGIRANMSDWISEITKYDGNPNRSLNDYYVGMRIGEIWGYKVNGIFQNEQEVSEGPDQSRIAGGTWRPGDLHYADINGDGEVGPGSNTVEDPGDRMVIGNNQPRYSFGLNLDVQYKNFGIATFFQGVGKRDYWVPGGENSWFWPFGANTMIEKWHVSESWSEDNRDALFHAPNIRDSRNRVVNDRYLQNAAYIRFKNLRITYNFPATILNRIGLNVAQVYVAAQNLGEITNIHRPLDPESIFSGDIQYPHQRTYSIGINISL